MKRILALLLVFVLLLTGCVKAPPEKAPEDVPEESREIVPEAAISLSCLNLRVAYATDTGFVGWVEEGLRSAIRNGKEINVVIDKGVEVGRWEDETTRRYFDATEVIYEPGMLVEVQFAGLPADTIYPELLYIHEEESGQIGDFALRLFQVSFHGEENILLSPYSMLCALAMTASGADGNTRKQMETVLGQSRAELSRWYIYHAGDNSFLHLANGIWFKDDSGFAVNEEFLQRNTNYYQADIHKGLFDETTVEDINCFVEENTNGMIRDMIQDIPEEAVMYLVNALAFEAQWQEVYKENQVHQGIFTTEDGREQNVQLMYSEELRYLENDLATGFIKHYKSGYSDSYAFVALLPKEGVSVAEMVQGLEGKQLQSFLANAQYAMVNAAIPKFETEFEVEMRDVLKVMGMTDAFDEELADFSGLATYAGGNIYLDRVIHKTFISVAEQGTRAGAATVIEVAAEEAAIEETKEVILNRPFLYMIVDANTCTPIFMGTLMDIR